MDNLDYRHIIEEEHKKEEDPILGALLGALSFLMTIYCILLVIHMVVRV